MLRRIAVMIALAAALAPAASRAHEWEEDYTDGWTDEQPISDPADVDVDVDASVSIDTFHGSLAPYGEWIVVGTYGRVWRPHVATGWRPYYYGRWEWTNEGWLWVSDEPWGWAAYHYGRWTTDPYYGWVWVPGYQWAPAWVSWRYSGDVVGWAPLAPGVSVYVSVSTYHDNWWTFVPCHSFVAHPVHAIAYQPSFTRRYWHATVPAPAFRGRTAQGHIASPAWGGPPPRTIEQRIGRRVTPVRVVPAPSPGAARVGNGEVAMYRPGLRGWNGPRTAPAPRTGLRDDGRFPPRFRSDGARPESSVRSDDAPRSFPGGGDKNRDFIGDVRAHRDQQRAWNRPDRGPQSAMPVPTPAPRQEAPRFTPRGGSAPSHDAAPQQRSWGGGPGGGELRHGGGAGAAAPRATSPAPRGSGGDSAGGERRGHR
jgi:hypothetical protein